MSILDQIVQTKHEEVAQRSAHTPLAELKRRVLDLPKCRNFYRAVTTPTQKPVNLIAEIKKASPSAGIIRHDFDPVKIAKEYEAAGADCLSVLTDEKYFQGKLEYLEKVRSLVTLPVLRKDCIVDPWQVYESRAAGADAVLLIAECLETGRLMDLQILATELHMT